MSLKNFLERELITCEPTAKIREVACLMHENDVGAVLVTKANKPEGIVTDRDIVIRCVAEGADCANQTVDTIMSTPVETVSMDAGIHDVTSAMKASKIRRIPVVDKEGTAVGLLSFGDVFQLIGKEVGDLAASSAPESPKIVEKKAA